MTSDAPPLRIVVDDREQAGGLIEELAQQWPRVCVGRLPAGDVEIGRRVLVERKTVADFVASLDDGRLWAQAGLLTRVCERPLLVIEGEDPLELAGLGPKPLRGVFLTLMIQLRIPLLRTSSVDETAEFLAQLAAQESRRAAPPPRSPAPRPHAVRAALDLLGAIPGVGDYKARRLLDSFGSVKEVINAPENALRDAPGIGPVTARAVRRTADSGPVEGAPPPGSPGPA